MAVSSSTSIFLLSLLGVPMSWAVNTASTLHGEVGLLLSGVTCLCVTAYLTHLCVRRPDQQTDYLFYGMFFCASPFDFTVLVVLREAEEVLGTQRLHMRTIEQRW